MLKAHASRVDAWPPWRDRALQAARAAVVEARGKPRPAPNRWNIPSDGSALVRMHRGTGADAEFAAYLATVRAGHARKRNFTKLLDATGW